MRIARAAVPLALLAAAFSLLGQERSGPSGGAIYQVQFSVRDGSDAAAKNDRNYSFLTTPNRKAIFRVGDRVPVATSSSRAGGEAQFTYIDIGVNIECTVAELNGKLGLHGNIDLTTIDRSEARAAAGNPNPTVQQTRLDLDTAVDPGKPTVVAAIDDPVTTRKLRVEVTVARVN